MGRWWPGWVLAALCSTACSSSHPPEAPCVSLDGGRDDAGPRTDGGPLACRFDSDCSEGLYCRPMRDLEGTCQPPSDTVVRCESRPQTGDRCDLTELPPDTVCRQGACDSCCQPTCACVDGRWSCPIECRSPAADGGPDDGCLTADGYCRARC